MARVQIADLPLPYRRLGAALAASLLLHLLLVLTIGPLQGRPAAVARADVLHVMLALEDAGHARAAPSPDSESDRTQSPPLEQARRQGPDETTPAARAPVVPEAPRYYPVSDVDQPAEVINDVLLRYPPEAFAQAVEGRVTLRMFIGADGRVDEIEVRAAEPPGVFEQAALEAAWQLRYRPAMKDGKPVANVRTVAIVFDPGEAPL